jgi:hypothetical protein
MEQHIDQVRKVFKKSGFNDKDIYRLASVLSRLEAEVGSSKCWNVGDVQVLDKAFTTSHAYHPCYKNKYTKVLWMYKNNSKSMSYRKLANEFDLNYNVVRSICNYERS